MSDKTVYILGAGSSKTANLPTQVELLPLIFSIRPRENNQALSTDDFLSLSLDVKAEEMRGFYSIFDEYRQSLGKFIIINFSSADKINRYHVAIQHANSLIEIDADSVKQREDFLFKAYDIAKSINVTLEDLFTIFDNVSAGREHFRLYSPDNMSKIHRKLKLCIIYALVYSISTSCNDMQYKRFAKLLLNTRLATAQKEDKLAVITMNWDDVLERSLFSLCNEYNSKLNKGQQRIFLDLCFYDYSLNTTEDHIPSTHIKAKGHKNIKILKMHGSLGWLECPKCGKIYTDFSREIAADEYAGLQCPNCKTTDLLGGEAPILRSLIITPTYMKSLDNLNIKNIWHNAFIDISEADHLVLIGYSFPDADFEMRCLLKKAIKANAFITVVLSNSDDPQKYIHSYVSRGYSQEESVRLVNHMWLPEERYKSFFGEDKVEFIYKGFEGYLDEIGGNTNGQKTNE